MEKKYKIRYLLFNKCQFFLDVQILFKTIELILFKKKQYKDFKNFMNKRLAIIGAGGHGKVVGECLLNKYAVIDFLMIDQMKLKNSHLLLREH